MIITRAPLRITFAGGGTDLPSYSNKYGGKVLSAAINKYVFVSALHPFDKSIILKYSINEKVKSVSNIKHHYFKKALKKNKIKNNIEITTLADIPSGTGLGSSGSFSVALLQTLSLLKKKKLTKYELAEEASKLEINDLKMNVGRQDQYIATFGGFRKLIFQKNKNLVSDLDISKNFLRKLESNSILFFTGYTRNANDILKNQKKLIVKKDKKFLEKMKFLEKNFIEVESSILNSNFYDLANLIDEQWQNKKNRAKNISNDQINQLIEYGKKNGALSGKLLGAGGGGFILFLTNNKNILINAMSKYKIYPTEFKFDLDGVKTINY